MAFTHTLTRAILSPEGGVSADVSKTGSISIGVDESIVTATTDGLLNIAFDKDDVKSIYILSDQAITIETNDGVSPGNTINLVANQPLVWQTGDYYTNKFTVDVTAFYITNTSGSTASLKIRILSDATP